MELQGSESERRHAQVSFVVSSEVESDPRKSLQGVPRDCARNDTQTLKPAEPRIRKIVARAIRGPARWVDFAVWLYRYRTSLGFAAAVSQIANEFLTCVELCARRLVSIEIAYQTNAERDVVQIIAVHMTAVYLAPPSIADFDLAVAG